MSTVVADVESRIAALEARNAALRAVNDQLEADNNELRDRLERREATIERLQGRVAELTEKLAAARRAWKRQAAPHSRNDPNPDPARPGRKPGVDYGQAGWRPPPDEVDEVVEVPLPGGCPHCGGHLELDRVAHQYLAELPTEVHRIRFDIHIGVCRCCGVRVQPRHKWQVSDALGAAASQLGPRAVGLAALLNKQCGVSAGNIATLYGQLGLEVTAAGIVHAVARAARAAEPTYQALIGGIRASPVVSPDETGWRVAGCKAWLWAFVGDKVTVFRIADGRGFDQAAEVLGQDYAGVLERDGWAPYRKFDDATHQTCLAHLARRVRGLIDDAYAGQAKTPHAVRRILQAIFRLRDTRDAGEITSQQLAAETAGLGDELDALIGGDTTYPPNRKLLNHLHTERDAIFTCLTHDGVAATNWRSEQAIRPAVVNRRLWGGNRTWTGAATQQILTSVVRTCRQQHTDPLSLLVELLRDPNPGVATKLTIPRRHRG